jgi:hydroxymethylpyrimidine/phosphomethylpyrimidine kinase
VKNNVDLESKYLSMLPVKVQIKFAKALLGVNKLKKSLVRKSTLIIPNMGEMKLIQKYFDPCRKAVDFR